MCEHSVWYAVSYTPAQETTALTADQPYVFTYIGCPETMISEGRSRSTFSTLSDTPEESPTKDHISSPSVGSHVSRIVTEVEEKIRNYRSSASSTGSVGSARFDTKHRAAAPASSSSRPYPYAAAYEFPLAGQPEDDIVLEEVETPQLTKVLSSSLPASAYEAETPQVKPPGSDPSVTTQH